MWFKVLLLMIAYFLIQLFLIFEESIEILQLNLEELINIVWG